MGLSVERLLCVTLVKQSQFIYLNQALLCSIRNKETLKAKNDVCFCVHSSKTVKIRLLQHEAASSITSPWDFILEPGELPYGKDRCAHRTF